MRRMLLICEFRGSRRKSWGPRRRWGSDFVLEALDECHQPQGWSLGCSCSSPQAPAPFRAGGALLILILLHQDNNNDKGETR